MMESSTASSSGATSSVQIAFACSHGSTLRHSAWRYLRVASARPSFAVSAFTSHGTSIARRPRSERHFTQLVALISKSKAPSSQPDFPQPPPPSAGGSGRSAAKKAPSTSSRKASYVDDTEEGEELCFVDECTELYRMPPPEIARLVDASVDPAVSLQPVAKEYLILLDRPNLPPIAEVAAEELRLAGFRVNATTYAPSRADYFIGIHLQRIDDSQRTRLPVTGLPEKNTRSSSHEIGYLRWSPDGRKFAFCVYEPLHGLELWCADVDTREARCVLPGVRLNAVCGDPFTWSSDSRTLVAKFVIEERSPPTRPLVPRGPVVQENMSSKPAPSRTYQDLLKDRHDVALFAHYTTCQLGRVDVDTGVMTPLGLPAAFRRASPSPDGKYILADAMNPPYQYMTPAGRFPRTVEVWSMDTGEVVATVADIPLQDKIPIAFDGVGEGPRGIGWRSDAPSTLYWAEAQDGGDPNVDAEIRDCIYTLPAPFTGAPRRLASLAWRYNGIVWGTDSVALLIERRYKTRSSRSYLIAPGKDYDSSLQTSEMVSATSGVATEIPDKSDFFPVAAQGPCCARACDLGQGEAPRRKIIDITNWEDRYNDPGNVCTVRNEAGKIVLRLMHPHKAVGGKNEGEDSMNGIGGEIRDEVPAQIGRPFFLMQGAGASDDGDRPFLSVLDTVTGEQTRIWQSCPPKFETVVSVLDENPETGLVQTVLLRQETRKENPNFFIFELRQDESVLARQLRPNNAPASPLASRLPITSAHRNLRAVTAFPHPSPELADVQYEMVHYKRKDGVRLNANLYLPPGYNKEHDGPLPVFIWAYPREFKSAIHAGQTRGSPYTFVRLARTPLYWLTAGYAILDGPAMPIVGEGDAEPNDTYVQQLVMSAEAAVDFLVERGVAVRHQIAIGGHSYGAFMAVNLLAHAPDLFCCGIARSGAYNRTLTPFGFQSEERTLFQAPSVYTEMSPYIYADRIKSPLLLIHGEADNNPGTFPMQSERLYQALKGHGKICRYVSLPHEGHGYRARESVMHALAEMTDWLDRFSKNAEPTPKWESSLKKETSVSRS